MSRKVSLVAQIENFLSGMNIFAWAFLLFAFFTLWTFYDTKSLRYILFAFNETQKTEGTVTYTDYETCDVSDDNGCSDYPFRIGYYYKIDSVDQTGYSYSEKEIKKGTKVPIEYLKNTPEISRIENLYTGPHYNFYSLLVLLPLCGIIFVIVAFIHSFRTLKLLKYGEITEGKLLRQKNLDNRIIERTHEYKDTKGQKHIIIQKTTQEKLENDKDKKTILYDPQHPENAKWLKGIGNLVMKENQSIDVKYKPYLILYLTLPAINILIIIFSALKFYQNY